MPRKYTCARCGDMKYRSGFYRKREAKSGLTSYCRDCLIKLNRKQLTNADPDIMQWLCRPVTRSEHASEI